MLYFSFNFISTFLHVYFCFLRLAFPENFFGYLFTYFYLSFQDCILLSQRASGGDLESCSLNFFTVIWNFTTLTSSKLATKLLQFLPTVFARCHTDLPLRLHGPCFSLLVRTDPKLPLYGLLLELELDFNAHFHSFPCCLSPRFFQHLFALCLATITASWCRWVSSACSHPTPCSHLPMRSPAPLCLSSHHLPCPRLFSALIPVLLNKRLLYY